MSPTSPRLRLRFVLFAHARCMVAALKVTRMKPVPGRSPRSRRSAPARSRGEARVPDTRFPVVGIGCSAGGLPALERFLSELPVDTGAAFVIVQHLDPTHASALPDILRRSTSLPVIEVEDGLTVVEDHVYVIPPNKDLSFLHGRLLLFDRASRGPMLPIDFFLRSLAEDLQERAVGIILSGMGSDGLLGLRAIKEKGGLTLAQDPDTAKAPSMPRCAIDAGLADIVAAPEALPERVLTCLRHPGDGTPQEGDSPDRAIEKIVTLLRVRTGNDFSQYKSNTLQRRIERRMGVNQVASTADYVRLLRGNVAELDLLFKELLIGVTSFFRGAGTWSHVRSNAIPALFARHPAGKAFRAWVPGCSTGEEAYTLAMVFRLALLDVAPTARYTLQIYATDLDGDAIEQARKGWYADNILADVPADVVSRWMTPDEGGGYRINRDIRDMIVFAAHNVASDPPFTKLDILSCRNLLIYLGAPLQKHLMSLFHYALCPGGLLLLGNAETTSGSGHLFETVHHKVRLFRRLNPVSGTSNIALPRAVTGVAALPEHTPAADRADDIGRLTDHLIQHVWAPPAVLVNADGDILYISGRTGKYLEPAAGRVNINIHAMARDGLKEALVGVIQMASRHAQPIVLHGIPVGTSGGEQRVDITVQALEKPEPLRGRVLVVFKDVAAPPASRAVGGRARGPEARSAREELRRAREALQVVHEEMQTTVEELKASNEELQSANEELQSTNEELTTSREELQSLNEEMQTVNAELQSKVDDLTWVQNDMANLLNSTEIATVFLDGDMHLRRFTIHATKLFKLIPSDVGRPLSHVVTDLAYPRLHDDAREVLGSLVFRETVVPTHDGRWYRVRIMPYRTQDNVIDGVVMTFTDITAIKQLEAELRKQQD
jgi:two-component system, chemotaxis family, CheB/CheR fusion protein